MNELREFKRRPSKAMLGILTNQSNHNPICGQLEIVEN